MIVLVEVMPKQGILDPQGKAVKQALHQLGYDEVKDVKIGKIIRIELENGSREEVLKRAEEMGEKLLCNPNVESFRVMIPEEKQS